MIRKYICPYTGNLLLVNTQNPICTDCNTVHVIPARRIESVETKDEYRKRNWWMGQYFITGAPYPGDEKMYDEIKLPLSEN